MPDISMCQNSKCELRSNCYRYRAVPNPYRQSYGTHFNPVNGECERQMPIENGDRVRDVGEIDAAWDGGEG